MRFVFSSYPFTIVVNCCNAAIIAAATLCLVNTPARATRGRKINRGLIEQEFQEIIDTYGDERKSIITANTKEMRVELYFEDELFYSETLEGEKIINRVYQLDRDLEGDYTAVIKADERVYVEHFRI